jgi:hypothetical protein
MMLSTFWLVFAFIFALNGHHFAAVLIALPWFAHHRWERGR